MNADLKGGEGEVCWVQCANMWQDCSLTAVQRKTAFVEHSWWPELKMFGSMPWCSFPWHKLLPRLAQKNCCINLIDEFTSLLSPNVKVIFAGLLSLWTSVFFRGRASNSQDSPKASPRAIFKWKNSVEPLQLLSQWMTGGENWMPTCANMCHYVPAWANIAVCQLCRKKTAFVEQSWWPELNLFGSMRWCSFPRHKLLPRPAQKNCCGVWIWSMSLHPCFAEDDLCRFA